jgi:hypothetical protein
MSFKTEAGQTGSASSPAMMDFNSSTDSYGASIHIMPLMTAARTYTHSQATVIRTASISDDSMLAIVSFPEDILDLEPADTIRSKHPCKPGKPSIGLQRGEVSATFHGVIVSIFRICWRIFVYSQAKGISCCATSSQFLHNSYCPMKDWS